MTKTTKTPTAALPLLVSLCRDVAALDGAGLPVQHKAAIARAKRILAMLSKDRS